MKYVYVVCGYKRTGKDTLVKMFNEDINFNWIIYSSDNHKLKINNVIRIGLADELRLEVGKIYNISESIDYDTFKETMIRDGKTYRDILIEHGAFRREQNINYWVDKCLNKLKMNNGSIMITDWRYLNELEYMLKNLKNIITIRLYRSNVPYPPDNVISEHQLDDVKTDFLLVPKINTEEEFKKACDLFPQYKNYTRY